MTPFVLYAKCNVEYTGRAKSNSSIGNRLIIYKPDNTLLIHNSSGIPPLNYNRSKIEINNNIIISKGKELIKITILEIFNKIELNEWSTDKIKIEGSEIDYQNYIENNIEKILKIKITKTIREFDTGTGKVDICAIDENNTYHIIEVKRKRISINNIYQLYRYSSNLSVIHKSYLAAPSINNKLLNELEKFKFIFLKINII
jgi:RecB family endonuclease NucS